VTGTAQQDFDLLRGAMDGPVIGPADVDYDSARKVLNAVIDRGPPQRQYQTGKDPSLIKGGGWRERAPEHAVRFESWSHVFSDVRACRSASCAWGR
jgi:hypothetical protein